MDTSRANMKSMVHLSLMQVLMLNSVVCGLEFCASAAFTYIPPLLLKSGLSEEHMSFVLGIGPFLGFLLVPWIGHSSDNCRSRFGRRRPYILALSILLIVALVMIPYGEFFGVFALGPNAQSRRLGVGLLIVGSVLLDFTSQACLTPCEALLSDACKDTNQQDRAFMVYSFMVSIGGCIGYLITALDWTGSAVGLYFGSQERSAFSVLIILFSFSLFFTLVIAEEKPLRNAVKISGDKTQRTDDVEADNLIAKSDKTLGNTASIIPPQDPGYESGDNYYNDESYNPPPSANLLTGNGSNLPSPMLMQRTLSIPMTRFSVTLARFDALLCLVVARCYRYMPRNLRTICEMPAVLKRLAVAHFFSWTGIMAFNLYFTDFVGQIVYKGNPNAPEEAAVRLPAVETIKRTIRKQRQAAHRPHPLPGDRSEIQLPPQYTHTSDGERFLQYDSGVGDQNRILMFGTSRTLDILENAEHIYMDGTFKIVPELFYQLYTIHAEGPGGFFVPCIYALLPNKSREVYNRLFHQVKSLRPNIMPRTIMIDFEKATLQAATDAFPAATVHGCFYHFRQNLFWKIQNEGLQTIYQTNGEVEEQVRMIAAIAFVPLPDVENAFEALRDTALDELEPIFNYFEDIYIGRPRRRNGRNDPLFPHIMWNIHDRAGEELPRTNNRVEGWHRKMNSAMAAQHPSIWKFLDVLIKEQGLSNIRLNQAQGGHEAPQQRRVYRDATRRLAVLVQDYPNRPIIDFLRGISHNFYL